MTIIKHMLNYSNEFIKSYESWYDENFKDINLLWDYMNLLDFFKSESKYRIHCLVCHKHVTIENVKDGLVQFFTGEDSYKEALQFLYELRNKDYKFSEVGEMREYDIYPYY